jgi:hypothetical protein
LKTKRGRFSGVFQDFRGRIPSAYKKRRSTKMGNRVGINRIVISSLLLALLFAACSIPPIIPSGPAKTFSEAISRLSDITIMLPKSLKAADGSPKAAGRALGDTTVITKDSIAAVKSSAWADLQRGDTFSTLVNFGLKKIREYAVANEIAENTPFTITATLSEVCQAMKMPEPSGQFDLSVESTFKIAGTLERFTILGFIRITIVSSETTTLDVYAKFDIENDSGSPNFKLYMDLIGGTESAPDYLTMQIYTDMNGADGSGIFAANEKMGSYDVQQLMQTAVGMDGTITRLMKAGVKNNASAVTKALSVAFGNDQYGGLASLSINAQDPTINYFWSEFYDGSGNLIMRKNGDSDFWKPQFADNGFNLKMLDPSLSSAPDTATLRLTYDGGSDAWVYALNTGGSYRAYARERTEINGDLYTSFIDTSTDNGLSWTPVSKREYDSVTQTDSFFTTADGGISWTPAESWSSPSSGMVYKQAADWGAGDGIYYWKTCDYDNGSNSYLIQLYLGYKVPQPNSFMGIDFYVSKEFPLKNLLPLSVDYAARGYNLIQEEGETHTWNWTDWEGATQTSSWTNYRYFLDGNGNTAFDSVPTGDNPDILLDRLCQYDSYSWSGTSYEKIKGYFWNTNTSLPPYFQDPETGIVASVSAQLEAYAVQADALKFEDYAAFVQDLHLDPAFGDLK